MTDQNAGGGAGVGGQAAGQGGAGSGGGGGAPAPWHQGLDAETVGWAQNKGWLVDDPKTAFAAAAKAHREAQKLIGVPESELIRLPRPNAAEADVKAFLGKIGVPAEAKDYDFAEVKFADGTELGTDFADTMRAALYNGRVPKDRAADIVKSVVKFMDQAEALETAEQARMREAELDGLKRVWGRNYDTNVAIAKLGMQRITEKFGITKEQADQAFDALAKTTNWAITSEIMRLFGMMSREDNFVTGGAPGAGLVMTPEQAKAEIDALIMDKAFRNRIQAGDVASKRKWDELHAIWNSRFARAG